MAKKPSILTRLKEMPTPKRQTVTFLDPLTSAQRKTLVEIRKARQDGEVTIPIRHILEMLQKEGFPLKVSISNFNNWLNKRDG
jgi:hypothetical protein